MLIRNEELEALCVKVWEASKEGREWGDETLFEEIGGPGTSINDFVNEGTSSEDGLSLLMLGAELAASPETHVAVDLGDILVVFKGEPATLLTSAQRIQDGLEG